MLCCDQEEETEAKDLSKMRNDFRAAVVSVLTDKEPTVRRAGLHGVLHLGAFFGQMFGATKTTQTSQKFLVDLSVWLCIHPSPLLSTQLSSCGLNLRLSDTDNGRVTCQARSCCRTSSRR